MHMRRIETLLLRLPCWIRQRCFSNLGRHKITSYLCDLDKIHPDRYKLVIFVNCYHVTTAEREQIARLLKRDGRTLAWCYAPGLFNQSTRSEEAMHQLTGIKIVAMQKESETPRELVTSNAQNTLAKAIADVVEAVNRPHKQWPDCN